MDKVQTLEQLVRDLYEARNEEREPWADWLYENHIFVVADYAVQLAKEHSVDESLVYAAAILHDVADAVMSRHDAGHEEKSADIARDVLSQSGYDQQEIEVIVDDALRFHSCRGDERPKTLEGKIVATADALAHLKTDFYLFGKEQQLARGDSIASFKAWVLEKIDRDLRKKIFFDSARESAHADYEKLKTLFEKL